MAAIIGIVAGSGGAHGRDAAVAAAIAILAVIAGLMPVRFAADRTAVGLFQSAWIGSILHLTVFLALGATVIFSCKPPTAFVIWLLAMYWLTLVALCVTLVRVIRSEIPQNGNAAGNALAGTPATKGE